MCYLEKDVSSHPCVFKKDCELVEPGSVKILAEVDTSDAIEQKSSITSGKRKTTPVKKQRIHQEES